MSVVSDATKGALAGVVDFKSPAVLTPLKYNVLMNLAAKGIDGMAQATTDPEFYECSAYVKGLSDALGVIHETDVAKMKAFIAPVTKAATETATTAAKVSKGFSRKKVFVVGVVAGVLVYRYVNKNRAEIKSWSGVVTEEVQQKVAEIKVNNVAPVVENVQEKRQEFRPEDGQL